MNEEIFWTIINKVKNSQNDHNTSLKESLINLENDQIKEFDNIYTKKLKNLWYWNNWQIAYIICGCNTEYDFLDFCNWVIFQGEDFNRVFNEKPDELFDYNFPMNNNLPYPYIDEIDLTPGLLYEEKTSLELPYHNVINYEPKGKRFKNKPKSLKTNYPNLYKRFWKT